MEMKGRGEVMDMTMDISAAVEMKMLLVSSRGHKAVRWRVEWLSLWFCQWLWSWVLFLLSWKLGAKSFRLGTSVAMR